MHNELPLKVQIIVFRKIANDLQVLLLKRSPEDGGFWNTVVGTLELNESIIECRSRELREEAGIEHVVEWSDELYRFTFPKKDYLVSVLVYAAEVTPEQEVTLNVEHTEYEWVEARQAVEKVEKENVKECIKRFITYSKLD